MSDNKTQFEQFLENLGAFESGIDTTNSYGPNDLDWLMVFDPTKGNVDRSSVDVNNPDDLAMLQYHVHNTLGFLGKYQFGEPLLIDLGYYTPGPNGFYGSTATNEWQGTFTGKNGVYSKEDFMSEVQEIALREAFAMNMDIINKRLDQAGHSIDDFLGQQFTYTRGGVEYTAEVSISGILASAHLQGPGGVANLLLNNSASSDEYGTNILFYMDQFGGYDTPFGTAGDDILSGSEYGETFSGETGDNIYTTGGGDDLIEISINPNGTDTITDFEVADDVLSLAAIPDANFNNLTIVNNADGNAEIQLANQQRVVLEGVDANELNASHFVQGPIKMSWNANTGDTVIENFNLKHDIVDLNYAFSNDNLAIYEENGSSVIEVIGNNQRLILDGISLDQLDSFNFIKAPIGFADAFFSDGADNTPPPQDDTPDDPVVTPPSDDNVITNPDGVYAFTWSWGANAVVSDFDITTDVIDLQGFWTSYDAFNIVETDAGIVIDMSDLNNQTITINDVSLDAFSSANIVGVTGDYSDALRVDVAPDPAPEPDPQPAPEDPNPQPDPEPVPDPVSDSDIYSYTWAWGSQDRINDFDVNTDVVNLQSFWTSYDSFEIYNDTHGNVVIDLGELNNQSITIEGVTADELSASNISGVVGNFADAVDASVPEPPQDNDEPNTQPPANDNDGGDVFSFTWNWGAESVIQDFDVANDAVDLKSFWTSRDQVPVYTNTDGNAVIDLSDQNNQTIVIEGVAAEELSNDNILF